VASIQQGLSLLRVGSLYWLGLHARVRRDLELWERRARQIPDETLRGHAVGQLRRERLNPEAAALFALLAPRSRRQDVVSLIVAYQVLYDYLDAVNEEPSLSDLDTGLRLHAALRDAVLPERRLRGYYPPDLELNGGDGGYLRALTRSCQRIVRGLPAAQRCGAVLARSTERCGQAQSRNHAMLLEGETQLAQWSLAHAPEGDTYLWWEIAAGGISCLAIHAVLASAADPATEAQDAQALDSAYFPAICAISSLLDSLCDYHADAGTSNHSFVSHYRDAEQAAARLVAITAEAREGVQGLGDARLHTIILAGIVSYYLSSRSVGDGFPALAARQLASSSFVGSTGTSMRLAMRVRRRVHERACQRTGGDARPSELGPSTPAARGARALARR
jgi:tetraprenyl-beta-curcumene synthase